jgi:phospholipase D1/2
VTLPNLRNWQEVTGPDGKTKRIVTEQVYAHTKLMIVDDLYALLGSANINDRSLLGSRDLELAVLMVDGATSRADVNGKGGHARSCRLGEVACEVKTVEGPSA